MPVIDPVTGEVRCKITYYGPPMNGKCSSFQEIHRSLPKAACSPLESRATETERTLWFECLPPTVPCYQGRVVRFLLETVPGAVLYEITRTRTLGGTDGVVYVADSQRDKIQYNIQYLQEMCQVLHAQGRKIADVPIVLQYTKRDIPNPLPAEVMDKYLNPLGWPRFASSIAFHERHGTAYRSVEGVIEAFEAICALTVARLGG